MEKLIKQIKTDINNVIKTIKISELVSILDYASKKYYNDTPILNDNQYDILYDLLKKKS